MVGAIERYQKLGLRELLSRVFDYPVACHELSFILRRAYIKLPKNLQALVFQDILVAFRFLPQVQTRRGIPAANLLLQAAEVALPKQKRVLAVAEFKHAVVAHKRLCKSRKAEGGSSQLPQDLVVHIFSFLDMRSLVAAGLVCWSWNLAANDGELWRSQYILYFGNSGNCSELKGQIGEPIQEKVNTVLHQKEKDMDSMAFLDWKRVFKGAYLGNSSRRSTSNRGYCWRCKSIVWLSNMRCANVQNGLQTKNHEIKPLSLQQVVEYLVEDSSAVSYLDSDTDSDEESASRLWAVPKHITDNHKTLFM